jgi:hypothetical protein
MERSTKLVEELHKVYDAFSNGDGELAEQAMSARDGLVFIGTDPDEWFEDVGSVRRLLEAQAGAGIKVEHGDAQAFEEGTVGWVADRGSFVLPDGSRVPFRITGVFHRENGGWKLVQGHTSVAMPNADVVGTDLSS